MANIILIGASGFVGTRLIEQIGPTNCHNIDKKPSFKYPEITTIQNILENGLSDSIPLTTKTIVLLAAEHRDDVYPTSLYYDVNVDGARKVVEVMDKKGIQNLVFTSSVAVFGLNKNNPDESHPVDPFNHYGKSKWQAEEVLREWYNKDPQNRSLTIIRPTVIFGEGNRGNVYNLLKQISSGKFLMIGNGKNYKSMAYVGNIVAFIKYIIDNINPGYYVYNYADKPDITMKELVNLVDNCLNNKTLHISIPYFIGMLGGYFFDFLGFCLNKKYSITSVRIKKFCATTQFDSSKVKNLKFISPYSLKEGLQLTLKHEFENIQNNQVTFLSE